VYIEGIDERWPSDALAEKLDRKHRVDVDEVWEVFFGSFPRRFRTGRDGAYECYGRTESGRYLFVPFVFRDQGAIWPLTARNMTAAERSYYLRKGG
jgi:uncharacterized DUF497 family protein